MNAMKQYGITQKNAALARCKKVAVGVVAAGSAVVANVASAIDDAAITAAQEAAETSVELTATGMIQIVAIIVGVGLVLSLLKRV